MELAPVYIKDIHQDVVASTNAVLRAKADSWFAINNKNINCVWGSKNHVIQQLRYIQDNPKAKDDGITKYPMIALMYPVKTRRGNSDGYYGLARPPVIYFATLSDNKRLPENKYVDNFAPILTPMYDEYFRQLSRHPNVILGADINSIPHDLWEYPADNTDEANTIFTDFLDILSVEGLEFTMRQLPISGCIKRIG